MNDSDTEKLRYRLDSDTHEIVKYTVVPATERIDSVADFTRMAINRNVKYILKIAAGGRTAKSLIRRLSDIGGIQEDEPDISTKPKIEGNNLSQALSAEIPVEEFGLLRNIRDETDLPLASTAVYCIFRKLNRIADQTDLLKDWEARKIRQTWTELKDTLFEPQLRLHSILTKRFRIHQSMPYFIRQDIQAFEGFAEEYYSEFYDTDQYDRLQEIYCGRTFSDVENTIEEYTEYEFTKNKTGDGVTGFLEKEIDD